MSFTVQKTVKLIFLKTISLGMEKLLTNYFLPPRFAIAGKSITQRKPT